MIIVLILYILYLIGYILYSTIGVYHLWRFGYIGDLTKPVIIAYISISAIIIIFSVLIVLTRNWSVELNLL